MMKLELSALIKMLNDYTLKKTQKLLLSMCIKAMMTLKIIEKLLSTDLKNYFNSKGKKEKSGIKIKK